MHGIFSPHAVPLQGLLGRPVAESHDETRNPFQRDRDRIIHSQAFRRLQGKTQVFVAGEGDHFRSRLTHTMEVAQISRDIARTLGLNEDLSECIALAHDLGHPPFGHMGEAALDVWMRKRALSFEHNEQSLRIVTVLEEHSPLAPGLNLNHEVLEGLQKHSGKSLSLEAQAVNIADEIAYTGHDCDDGVRAGLFTIKDLGTTALGRAAIERSSVRKTAIRGAVIHLLVSDLYAATQPPVVQFSDAMLAQLTELKAFLRERMYFHPRVLQASTEGQKIVTELCEALFASPTEKVTELMKKTGSTLPEAVKDYVAGMTDGYARMTSDAMINDQLK